MTVIEQFDSASAALIEAYAYQLDENEELQESLAVAQAAYQAQIEVNAAFEADLAVAQGETSAAQTALTTLTASILAAFSPDPDFQASRLSADNQSRYTRIWTNLRGTTYPDPLADILAADAPGWVARAAPLDTRESQLYYIAGRTLGSHYHALTLLLVATHDPALMDEMVRLMDVLAPLLDKYPDPPVELDDILTYNLVALHALVLTAAGRMDESDVWVERLLTRVDGDWGGAVIYRSLAHVALASIAMNWWLFLLTGQTRFKTEADKRRDVFLSQLMPTPSGGVAWDHRMPISAGNPAIGCQDVGYGRYSLQTLLMCALTGYPVVAPETLTRTVLGLLHADGTTSNDLCGAGTFRKVIWPTSLYGAFARWDTTDEIAAFSVLKDKVADRSIFIPVSHIYAST